MTYKIISAIIRDNLRFDTLPIIKANVLYDINCGPLVRSADEILIFN